MTMPSGNINLITDVRDNFMQDSSGSASLNSDKYRDGAGKGIGNVALTDFANVAWRNGRTKLDQPSASSVRPYHAEGGVDIDNYFPGRITIEVRDGAPVWKINGPQYAYMDQPVAWYMSSGFKVMRPGIPHTITWQAQTVLWSGKYGSLPQYLVRGYANGYKSGSSINHRGWTPMNSSLNSWRDNSYTFTPDSRYPYILLSTRVFYQLTDEWPESHLETRKWEVKA